MSAQIIYGVVFGKPKTEDGALVGEVRLSETQELIEWCKPPATDDVYYMNPPIQLPSDTEPTD